ncbi:MAG: hypothetical protein AB1898_22780 [Acidobacteriota bacterium]
MKRSSPRAKLRILTITTWTLGLSLQFVSAQHPDSHKVPDKKEGPVAPRLQNLGTHHHPVTTKSDLAQTFFDQGLRLVYAFNHAEAGRSFREAARLDTACAMAYWGQALALGPNINAPMEPSSHEEAWQALQKALALKPKASKKEQAYIDALAKRYSQDPKADRRPLDEAFAQAMGKVSKQYPDDLDAATLYAEALMDLQPWSYWNRDGSPRGAALQIVSLLESVLKRNPNHPGALHYYIHAVEASRAPERGVAAADRLGPLMPAAGHLVHMPAHIYIRVGRYADASESNIKAVAADEDYITQCRAQGIYPLAYHPHNIHFLWAALTLEGRSAQAIEEARKVASKAKPELLREPGLSMMQQFLVIPLYAFSRFGKWDEILREPPPPEDLHYPLGVWHYARGLAYTGKGQWKEAEQELESLKQLAAEPALKELKLWDLNPAAGLLEIASEALAGELAAKKGDLEKAVMHLDRAVRLEDAQLYNEPPDWHYPVRQSLGAVLLKAGRPLEAEVVYWEDLKRNPENGWSLFGLAQSLKAQGKTDQVEEIEKRFRKAWAKADIELKESRIL